MVRERRWVAVEVYESIYRAPRLRELEEYKLGMFYAQSLPAMLVSLFLEPQANEVIVDMCAGPGGKATHLAQLSQGAARIIALDHTSRRVELVRKEVERLRLKNVIVLKADSRYLHLDYPWIKADKVLVDPPCSSLGVRPKLFDRKNFEDVKNLANYQKQFIREAWLILKPGGLLAYSTCTTTLLENEENIEYAMEIGFKPVEPPILAGSRGATPYYFRDLVARFHPHKHPHPGFFIALLRKP